MSANIYEMVTERVLAAIEGKGVLPWKKPWVSYDDGSCYPRNLVSGRCYQGINALLLGFQYYESPFWVSVKQCNERGGKVRKGETGSIVVYWKILERYEVKDGKTVTKRTPLLRYSVVFNSAQCEGLEVPGLTVKQRTEAERITACEEMIERYEGRPEVEHFKSRAAYDRISDKVLMPGLNSFHSSEEYYSTLFHEYVHSTGHASRLNRLGLSEISPFGSEAYGREELVAEIGASFLCAETGIAPRTEENSLAYLQGWATTIRANPKLIVEAASQAQKAADWISGRKRGPTSSPE